MKRTFTYTIDSAQADERAIHRMNVFRHGSNYHAMDKYCEGLVDFAKAYGFTTGKELQQYKDAKYYRSVFFGRRCYFIAIDGVDYIWCDQEEISVKRKSKIVSRGTRCSIRRTGKKSSRVDARGAECD